MLAGLSWLRLGVVLLAMLGGMSAALAEGGQTGGAAATGTRLAPPDPQEVYSADQYRLAVRSYLVYRFADADLAHRVFANTAALEARLAAMLRHWNRRVIADTTVYDLEGPDLSRFSARIVDRINEDSRRFGVEAIEHGFLSIARVTSQ